MDILLWFKLPLPTIGSNEVFSLGIPEPKKWLQTYWSGGSILAKGGFAYHEIWGESRRIHRGRCLLLNYHWLHCFSSWFEPLWKNIRASRHTKSKNPNFPLEKFDNFENLSSKTTETTDLLILHPSKNRWITYCCQVSMYTLTWHLHGHAPN